MADTILPGSRFGDYEILEELEAIHALLSAHCLPDFKMLATVSPVPLQATFRPEDVMTANAYSKAVQRAALEAFVLRHNNVDYFPSFETVTLTDRRKSGSLASNPNWARASGVFRKAGIAAG